MITRSELTEYFKSFDTFNDLKQSGSMRVCGWAKEYIKFESIGFVIQLCVVVANQGKEEEIVIPNELKKLLLVARKWTEVRK